MSISRRQFLQNGLGFISLSLTMPTVLMDATRALAAESVTGATPAGRQAARQKGKILVVIEMQGGNDGLNTVIPVSDALYGKYRANIGVAAADAIKIDQGLGLHPSMSALAKLYKAGKVAVVTGVGYPNPNRSHFQSMDIWQSGNAGIDARERTGWLARYFDADGHYAGSPLAGVVLGNSLPLALWSQDSPTSVIGDGEDYGFSRRGRNSTDQLNALKTLYDQGAASGGTMASGARQFIQNVGQEVYSSTDDIKDALHRSQTRTGAAVTYPLNSGLASGLQTVAKLIGGDLATRVYYLTLGGFDTHSNQPDQQARQLGQLSEAISAFYQDLENQGRQDDVTLMTFSEFGRRVQENGSNGTDHGTASVLFVVGGAVKGGVHGEYPALSDLENGDLRFHTDFRSVYATILSNWLGMQPGKVLGGEFPTLKFV